MCAYFKAYSMRIPMSVLNIANRCLSRTILSFNVKELKYKKKKIFDTTHSLFASSKRFK